MQKKENENKKKERKKKYSIEFHGSKSQYDEIKNYFDNLSTDLIIFGLRFSYNRNKATVGWLFKSRSKKYCKERNPVNDEKTSKNKNKKLEDNDKTLS